jgi:hypothetical protein
VLLQEQVGRLQDAVEASTKRKARKRQYIQAEETLTVGEVSDLVAATVVDSRNDSREPSKRVRAERRCGRCSKTGHNSRTCKVEILDAEDSEESK